MWSKNSKLDQILDRTSQLHNVPIPLTISTGVGNAGHNSKTKCSAASCVKIRWDQLSSDFGQLGRVGVGWITCWTHWKHWTQRTALNTLLLFFWTIRSTRHWKQCAAPIALNQDKSRSHLICANCANDPNILFNLIIGTFLHWNQSTQPSNPNWVQKAENQKFLCTSLEIVFRKMRCTYMYKYNKMLHCFDSKMLNPILYLDNRIPMGPEQVLPEGNFHSGQMDGFKQALKASPS